MTDASSSPGATGVTVPEIEVVRAFDRLLAAFATAAPLTTQHDPEWTSPCEQGPPDAHGRVLWTPQPRADWTALDPLSETLGLALHPSLRTFWGQVWSDGLPCSAHEGEVHLLGVWNEADHQRLLANLLGHAQQQKRRRLAPTFFFACTEPDSELILAVDNASGAVVLEAPGEAPRRTVAPDLASFLARLSPAPPVSDG